VRFYGMDAPETAKTDFRSGRVKSPGQPWGDEAEKALAGKISGRTVRVEVMDVDRYHRIVAIIWLGDRNINLEMVREGHAEAYREYLKAYRAEFLQAEREAKGARRGIWSLPNYERPCDFRRRMKMSGD
jgi:micrococcal nuclease